MLENGNSILPPGKKSSSGGSPSCSVASPSAMLLDRSLSCELVITLKNLLAAVTRILLLADNVVVKQLLTNASLSQQDAAGAGGGGSSSSMAAAFAAGLLDQDCCGDTMNLFTEFVKAFCDFGMQMIQMFAVIGKRRKTAKQFLPFRLNLTFYYFIPLAYKCLVVLS